MSAARVVRLVVLADEVGERVDRWIATRLASEGVSRTAATRLCDEGLVRLRDASVKPNAKLRAGDEVVVTIPAPTAIDAVAEDIPLAVVFEDEHLLVIDKPAGMVVHPAKGHGGGTLVNAVLHHAEIEADEGDDPLRPGIVHRIDRMTSGLLVVAKSAQAREALSARFKAHDIHRAYIALAQGDPGERSFDTLYDRHPVHRQRFTSRASSGRSAVTHVRSVERLAGGAASLVRCTLETGRTHQIRVHLSEHGHAIVGDPVYGRRANDPRVEAVARALGRQALHAAELGFEHPITGAPLRFGSELPDDFVEALRALRAIA